MRLYDGDMKKPMASVQIRKVSEAAGMEIGEMVSLTITGVVKSIDSPRETIDYSPDGSKAKMMPGCIEIEVKELTVNASGEDEADDDDEEY